MGMSIEEIIEKEQEMSKIFQRTVDTHMVSEDLSLEELYCDDTEIIEEKLKRSQELANFHNQIVNVMQKYQKVQTIVKAWNDMNSFDSMTQISEVVEDGKDT